jgi:hypothetical protein
VSKLFQWYCLILSAMLFLERSSVDAADPSGVKLPVPDADALTAANKIVDEKYRKPFKATRADLSSSVKFDRFLERESLREWDDPVAEFAFRTWCLSLPTDSTVNLVISRALRQLEVKYDVDGFDLYVNAAQKLLKASKYQDWHLVTETVATAVNHAIDRDQLDVAVELATKAAGISKSSKSRGVRQAFEELLVRAKLCKEEFAKISKDLEAWKQNESDTKAASSVGRYRLFYCRNMQAGLKLLAQCDDPLLAKIAREESEPPEGASTQQALAEAWYRHSQTAEGMIKEQSQRRSLYWYRESILSLSNAAEKGELAKRIAEIEEEIPIGPIPWGSRVSLSFEKSKSKKTGSEYVLLDAFDSNVQGRATGISMVAGRVGQAASFDRRSSLTIPNQSFSYDERSICCWINLREWPSSEVSDFLAGDCTYTFYEFMQMASSDAHRAGPHGCALGLSKDGARFRVSTGEEWIVVKTRDDFTFARDTWYHLTGTYDGRLLRIYINGHLHRQVLYSRGAFSIGTVLALGFIPDGLEEGFDGMIDEFAAYTRSLSAEEVDTLYRMGLKNKSLSK